MDIYWDAGCYAWDVAVRLPTRAPTLTESRLTQQAGAVIVSEAGGFFSGGKDGFETNILPGEAVMSRRYVFVRPVRPTEVSLTHHTLFAQSLDQTDLSTV